MGYNLIVKNYSYELNETDVTFQKVEISLWGNVLYNILQLA